MKKLISIFLFSATALSCDAQTKDYPVPPPQAGHLFYLQHSRNINTVVYELNVKNGNPDSENPVHAFWIRYGEKGQHEELSYIQRKFAYGINVVKLKDNSYQLNFVSKSDYKMYLQQSADGAFHIYTTVNKKHFILTHIYININGGSVLSPNIEYVDISGYDEVSKSLVTERVKIGS
jgi:hypothetical protein